MNLDEEIKRKENSIQTVVAMIVQSATLNEQGAYLGTGNIRKSILHSDSIKNEI